MVRDGVSCRETAIVIHRTDAANCAYGPPVTSHSCVVDHTERIDRSFLRWHRFAYSVCSGESRLGNDRRALYRRPFVYIRAVHTAEELFAGRTGGRLGAGLSRLRPEW